MKEFKKMLKSLETEEDLIKLTAKLMKQGVWESVACAVLDRCNELGGEGMEDAVYDTAWGIAHGC